MAFSLATDHNYYVTRTKSVAISAVIAKVLSFDPSRVGLVFSDPTGSNSFGLDKYVNDTGMLLGQPSVPPAPITLTFRDHGPLPMQEWWAGRSGGGSTLGIMELLYQPVDPTQLVQLATCAADYTIKKSNFTLSTTSQQLVKRDPTRVAMTVTDNTGTAQYGGPGVISNSTNLLGISSAYQNIFLDYPHHGPLVMEEWWGVRATGTSATGVIEVLYRPGAH